MNICRGWAATCALLLSAAAFAQAPPMLHVQVEGAVRTGGTFAVPPGSRLSDAALAAMPTRDAWPTGASLLRVSAAKDQVRLKAALIHDLERLQQAESPELRAVASALEQQLQIMPVTGRVHSQLDPRRLETLRDANWPLADGDRIVYPLRPGTVRIVGAVVEPCEVAHAPMRNAADYLHACPRRSADRDWLHVIQPDGSIQRLGIALWNRSAPQAVAPGAVLYVPLPEAVLRSLDGDFNTDFARFIATQPAKAQRVGEGR